MRGGEEGGTRVRGRGNKKWRDTNGREWGHEVREGNGSQHITHHRLSSQKRGCAQHMLGHVCDSSHWGLKLPPTD